MLTTFNDALNLLKKVITGDESLVYGYNIETKAQSSQWKSSEEPSQKKHVNFGKMLKFCLVFFSIAMAWCIMNFCHKTVWSINNNTLKLCADCAKQFVRNEENCGKTKHEFYTLITCQLTRRCLCMSFWLKTKP